VLRVRGRGLDRHRTVPELLQQFLEATARALGLVAVHHTSYDETAVELERLLGVPLRE
jgi:hypothetical protein